MGGRASVIPRRRSRPNLRRAGERYSFHLIEREMAEGYSAISTRHNAPQAGAGPLGRTGTCSFLRYSHSTSDIHGLFDFLVATLYLTWTLGGKAMLYWSLVFLVIAIIAGVLGFAGVAVAAAGIAKLLFVIFLILFLISLIMHLARGRTV